MKKHDIKLYITQITIVNTTIISPVGANIGIGFAVPVSTVKKVVPQLIEIIESGSPGDTDFNVNFAVLCLILSDYSGRLY